MNLHDYSELPELLGEVDTYLIKFPFPYPLFTYQTRSSQAWNIANICHIEDVHISWLEFILWDTIIYSTQHLSSETFDFTTVFTLESPTSEIHFWLALMNDDSFTSSWMEQYFFTELLQKYKNLTKQFS